MAQRPCNARAHPHLPPPHLIAPPGASIAAVCFRPRLLLECKFATYSSKSTRSTPTYAHPSLTRRSKCASRRPPWRESYSNKHAHSTLHRSFVDPQRHAQNTLEWDSRWGYRAAEQFDRRAPQVAPPPTRKWVGSSAYSRPKNFIYAFVQSDSSRKLLGPAPASSPLGTRRGILTLLPDHRSPPSTCPSRLGP